MYRGKIQITPYRGVKSVNKLKERNRMQVILGTKIGMTQIIGADGVVTPVTILQAGPATVTQIKTVETDGYNAVQVGYGQGKNLSKSVSGHVKKAGENINPKVLKEFRVEEIPEGLKVGDQITVDSFNLGDKVAATGISKGKGFPVPSNAGTSRNHVTPTASRAIFVKSVLSARCILKKFSKANACQAAWVTIKLP